MSSVSIIVISALVLLASRRPGALASLECDQSIVESVSSQCEHLERVQSLDEFLQFYAKLEHVNDKCLRLKSPLRTPSESSLEAESKCEASGISFYQVRKLARLARRWAAEERVCTIEFAVQLYHCHHNQAREFSADWPPARWLRLLANTVAWRCRFTLAKRLANVERRAPDSRKFNQLVLGMINVAGGNPDNLKPVASLEHFVPVLERELTAGTFGPEASNSLGRDGFELKSTNALRLSYEALKMSCNSLKPYQVNIFGSLGLLASLGYGDPTSAGAAPERLQRLRPAESRQDRLAIQRWYLSALLCQSLRNVLKMHTVSSEGKSLARFKIMDTQEADVTANDETDRTFAGFRLPESIPEAAAGQADEPQVVAAFASYKHAAAAEVWARKLHLLNGPNYALANSIGTYLDVGRPANRLQAVGQMAGLKLELDATAEEEEEEEE